MEASAKPVCHCSVEIRGLTVKKHDGVILDHIDLDVHHGEILALIGRNGAGKTTLLKALLGRCAYTGQVCYRNGQGQTVEKPRIGYVPQRLDFDRSAPITAGDLLCANSSRRPVWLGGSRQAKEKAAAMLQKVGGALTCCPSGWEPFPAASSSGCFWPLLWTPCRICCSWTNRFPLWTGRASACFMTW